MEGLLDRLRNFFRNMVNILPLGKDRPHVKILDSHGLIDESLYAQEESTIVIREASAVAVPELTKKALTELE
jgi:hypothetical protein